MVSSFRRPNNTRTFSSLTQSGRWYNTTYITIAASVLLLHESQAKGGPAAGNMALIRMAVEILEVMDESVVARNAAEVIRRFMRELDASTGSSERSDVTSAAGAQQVSTPGPWASLEVGPRIVLLSLSSC